MVTVFKCGHPSGWIIRLYFAGKRYAYCWGCLVKKVGLNEINLEQTSIAQDLGIEPKVSKVEKKAEKKVEEKNASV